MLNDTSSVVDNALLGNASLRALFSSLDEAALSIEDVLENNSTSPSQMSVLQMALAVIDMSLSGDLFIENPNSTLELVSAALEMAVNETTIPEPTALEMAAESILREVTDGNATASDIATALQEALEAIKASVAEELANEMTNDETTTEGAMESTTTEADMTSTTTASSSDETTTDSTTTAATDGKTAVNTFSSSTLHQNRNRILLRSWIIEVVIFEIYIFRGPNRRNSR